MAIPPVAWRRRLTTVVVLSLVLTGSVVPTGSLLPPTNLVLAASGPTSAATGLPPSPPVDTAFSESAWRAIAPTYDAILEHPFLRELQAGTLDRDVFAAYLVQDTHYLRAFARALRALAAKAPRADWAERLRADAEGSLAEERRLQAHLLAAYGIDADRVAAIEPSPAALAYASYLVATAHEAPFVEGLAAVLPCYWIYWEVGTHLAVRGSPEPAYQTWIDAYASEAYGEAVRRMLAIADAAAAEASPVQRDRMLERFARASRYEWMFWDSAYHQRTWPAELAGEAGGATP